MINDSNPFFVLFFSFFSNWLIISIKCPSEIFCLVSFAAEVVVVVIIVVECGLSHDIKDKEAALCFG